MIFPTTFFLTLFLAQIARAAPETKYYSATYNQIYDNPKGSLNSVACSELATKFSKFDKVPHFPYIGGAPSTTYNSPNCGAIWKIKANGEWIYYVGIDNADGFVLSLEAFEKLGGETATGRVEVEAEIVGNVNDPEY